jgi:hypothetical protein
MYVATFKFMQRLEFEISHGSMIARNSARVEHIGLESYRNGQGSIGSSSIDPFDKNYTDIV